jgi:hypothetical protein
MYHCDRFSATRSSTARIPAQRCEGVVLRSHNVALLVGAMRKFSPRPLNRRSYILVHLEVALGFIVR